MCNQGSGFSFGFQMGLGFRMGLGFSLGFRMAVVPMYVCLSSVCVSHVCMSMCEVEEGDSAEIHL